MATHHRCDLAHFKTLPAPIYLSVNYDLADIFSKGEQDHGWNGLSGQARAIFLSAYTPPGKQRPPRSALLICYSSPWPFDFSIGIPDRFELVGYDDFHAVLSVISGRLEVDFDFFDGSAWSRTEAAQKAIREHLSKTFAKFVATTTAEQQRCFAELINRIEAASFYLSRPERLRLAINHVSVCKPKIRPRIQLDTIPLRYPQQH